MSAKKHDTEWRWEMPTDHTLVEIGFPIDEKPTIRAVAQGTKAGWTKIVRIELGTSPRGMGVESIDEIPIPERGDRDPKNLVRPRALDGISEEEAIGAIRAAFRELKTYDATRAVKEITRSALIGDNTRSSGARNLEGTLRLAAVAEIYRELVEERGITRYSRHIAAEFNVTQQRAKELVEEARAAGYLGPARPGAAGEVRKPRKKKGSK